MTHEQLHHINALFHLAVISGFLFGTVASWLAFHFWAAWPHYKYFEAEKAKFAKERRMLLQIREAWKQHLALTSAEERAIVEKVTVRCDVQERHDTVRVS